MTESERIEDGTFPEMLNRINAVISKLKEEDKLFMVYVEKATDKATWISNDVDRGDAMVIINRLMTELDIHPQVLASMGPGVQVLEINLSEIMEKIKKKKDGIFND